VGNRHVRPKGVADARIQEIGGYGEDHEKKHVLF
jgi:hypothetical protein